MGQRLQHCDWIAGKVPDGVRDRIRQLVEVVGYLPHEQALGVVTADSVVLAANEGFLDLLSARAEDLLEADWDECMPHWRTHVYGLDGHAPPSVRAFDEYVHCWDGERRRIHVVALPVFAEGGEAGVGGTAGEPAGPALAAWTVFLTRPEHGRPRPPAAP